LRATEACDLEWSQVDFDTASLHVTRAKNGKSATHPIRGDELRALRQLRRDQGPHAKFVFTSERGAPFTTDALNRHSLWLCACEQRPRHALDPGLPGPQGDPAYGALHRAIAYPVQRLLARLK
jgi:integrase